MTSSVPLINKLRQLPRPERLDELADMVLAEFRTALLMSEDETPPLDESYFSLGLSSLGLMEVKERLEAQLGHGISATALFSHPTVQHLLDHLTSETLRDLFAPAQVTDQVRSASQTTAEDHTKPRTEAEAW